MFSKPIGRQLAYESLSLTDVELDIEEGRGTISRSNIDTLLGRGNFRRTRGREARFKLFLILSACLDVVTASVNVGALYTDRKECPIKARVFFYLGCIAFLGAIGSLALQGRCRLKEMTDLLEHEEVGERENGNGVPKSAYRWNNFTLLIGAILYAAALPVLFEVVSNKTAETFNIFFPLFLAIFGNFYDATLGAWEDDIKTVMAQGHAIRAYEMKREQGLLDNILNPERLRIEAAARSNSALKIQAAFRGFAVRHRAAPDQVQKGP